MEEFKVPIGFPKPANTIENTTDSVVENDLEIQKKCTEIKHQFKKSPAPQMDCPYIEPEWSSKPEQDVEYKFEVLKCGSIVEEIKNLQTRPFWVFGRLPETDILMAHPTVSRFHAVLQYRSKVVQEDNNKTDVKQEEGWHLYDLDSTHGTFLNKMRIPPRTYIRVKVGHMLKLGASTRNFILQGPDFDEEPESEMTVTEIKSLRLAEIEYKRGREDEQQKLREKEGISWGMAEDADEETDLNVNPYASTNNEEFFLEDPKKTLRGFFEREGLDLDYRCDEMSPGTFVCRIELPIDDSNGKPIMVEVCHKGKKKECVVQCALEACRVIDRNGLLRQAHHEPLKRKVKTSDSDEDDDFLDRTGDIARKKLRKENTNQNITLTYEDLIKQEEKIMQNLADVEENILRYQENTKRLKENNAKYGEDLDDFMENLTEKTLSVDKTEIRRLRVEQQRLTMEHQKTVKLIKIAKPIDILVTPSAETQKDETTKKTLALPLFGKRNKFNFTTIPHIPPKVSKTSATITSSTNEIEPVITKIDNENLVETEISNSDEEKTSSSPADQTKLLIEDNKASDLSINQVTLPEPDENLVISKATSEKSDTKQIVLPTESDNDLKSTLKKSRTRPRNRNRRENVDIDDSSEFHDAEKHSEWIPPTNQTGDGITKLNTKFGY